MSYLDALLRKTLQIAGVSLTERRYWNIVSGATAVDNPITKALDITIEGSGGESSAATAHGNVDETFAEVVTLDDTPTRLGPTYSLRTDSGSTVDERVTCIRADASIMKVFTNERVHLNEGGIVTSSEPIPLVGPTPVGGSLGLTVDDTPDGTTGQTIVTGLADTRLRWKLVRQVDWLLAENAAPTVLDLISIEPSTGARLTAVPLTLTGAGFVSGCTVTVGGLAATSVVFVNTSTVTCVTSALLATGSHTVVVTNPDASTDSLVGGYTATAAAAPTVTSIAPTSGASLTAVPLTLTGTGFVSGCTVKVGGLSCTSVVFVNSTSVTCTTAATLAAGAHDVVLRNPDTQTGTLAGGYTAAAGAPTVTSISPTSGTALTAVPVTLTGTGFVSGCTVTIGGDPATSVVRVNSTSITCDTPDTLASGAAYDIVVTNPDTQTGSLVNGYTALFNIASLPWELMVGVLAGYSGGGTWAGEASAGGSGSRDLSDYSPTAFGTPPTVGTAVDGQTPAIFDGIDHQFGFDANVEPTFVASTAYSSFALIYIESPADTDDGAGVRYGDPHIWADSASGVGMGHNTSGAFAQQADNSPAQKDGAIVACAAGGWHVIFTDWNGSDTSVQKDNGTPVTEAVASLWTGVSSAKLLVGTAFDQVQHLTGRIMVLAIKKTAWSGTEKADIYAALKGKFPSMGLP